MATKRTELITKLIESAFQNKYMAGAENVWFRKFDLVNPVQPFMWGLDSKQVEFKTCNAWLVKPNKKNRAKQKNCFLFSWRRICKWTSIIPLEIYYRFK